VSGFGKFCGAFAVDRNIYFIPYFASVIGVYNVDQGKFSVIPLDFKGDKFIGLFALDKKLYLLCSNSNILMVLDTETRKLMTMNHPCGRKDEGPSFHGGIAVDNKLIFSPFHSNYIGIISLD